MKRAPRDVRQASSLSGLQAVGDSESHRQAGSLSDIFLRRRFPSSIIFGAKIPPGVSILELLEQVARRRFELRAQFQRGGVKHMMTP